MVVNIVCSDGKVRPFRQIVLSDGHINYRDHRGRSPNSFARPVHVSQSDIDKALGVSAEIRTEFALGGRGRFVR
jgi:hypothetical protein